MTSLGIFLVSFSVSTVICSLPILAPYVCERDRFAMTLMGAWILVGVACGLAGLSLLL